MEIRCGSCSKLFRVSDEKIVGKGIKFACTRCGQYVKITREEFENHALSQTAVTVLDMFEQKPKTPPAPEPNAVSAEEKTAIPDAAAPGPGTGSPSTDIPKEPPLSESAIPDFLQERDEPIAFESSPFIDLSREQAPQTARPESSADAFQEPRQETKPASPTPDSESTAIPSADPHPEPEPSPEPVPAVPAAVMNQEPRQEVKAAPTAEPSSLPKPAQEATIKSETKEEPKPALAVEPKTEPVMPSKTAPPSQPKPKSATTPGAPAAARPVPKREPAKPAAASSQRTVIGAAPIAPPRSGSTIIIMLAAVILLGLLIFGVYKFMKPPETASPGQLTSVDGLRIENASGTPEANGDLLITGTVENATDKPQAAWLVVVDVSDATGKVIHKLRLLNGKQLYSKNDYEIMAQRGQNVQELKAKILSDPGTVIPPNGRVNFEIRYLQPPIGVSSFNPVLQPFDPARLVNEIASEAK